MKRQRGAGSNFKGIREDLLRLRAGELSLAKLRPHIRPVLKRLATYWHRRYEGRQTLLEREDLLSMGEVAVWRAVDTWDPAKRPIEDYVLCEVGRAMEKPLKAAAGWPDPRRPAPALQVYFSNMRLPSRRDGATYRDAEAQRAVEYALGLMRADAANAPPPQERDLERKEAAMEACESLSDDFGQVVAQLVLRGYTIQGAGAAMYGSKRLRRYFNLRDLAHAQRAAHAAAARVRQELAGDMM